jgi:hypothetical protein
MSVVWFHGTPFSTDLLLDNIILIQLFDSPPNPIESCSVVTWSSLAIVIIQPPGAIKHTIRMRRDEINIFLDCEGFKSDRYLWQLWQIRALCLQTAPYMMQDRRDEERSDHSTIYDRWYTFYNISRPCPEDINDATNSSSVQETLNLKHPFQATSVRTTKHKLQVISE